jgi:hypothetical protein
MPMIIAVGFLILAILVGSIVGLAFVAYNSGFLGRFWDALFPDFTAFNSGRGTTQTFRMLVMATLVFAAVLVVWAVGAGIMRTAWLYAARPDGVANGLSGEACNAADCGTWGFLLLFSALQVFRAAWRRAAHLSRLRPGRGISRIPVWAPSPNDRRGNAARGGPRSRHAADSGSSTSD